MTTRILLTALATATAVGLTAATAAPAGAQYAHDTAPRVIATYHFGVPNRALAFPTTIVVADSAGTLVANARIAGERAAVPMQISVLDSDLVLQSETRDGMLTLVLGQQAVSNAPRHVDGRWSLGNAEGRLHTRRQGTGEAPPAREGR